MCKACTILPSSYVLQKEFIRVGRIYIPGGLAEVSDGEYLGRPVAIKYIKVSGEDFNKIFKVPSISLSRHRCSAFPRGFVEKSSGGDICRTRTFCLCWVSLSLVIRGVSTFLRSGCRMET